MSRPYPYPFDPEGHEALTLPESIAAMRELEIGINGLIKEPWKWSELRFFVVTRLHGGMVYEVKWRGNHVGRITVDIKRAIALMFGP